MKRLLAAALALAALPAWAEAPKPFVAGTLPQIVAARESRPFLLGFWSINCSHCQEELALLGEFARQHPEADVVLVAADTPEDAPAIRAVLERNGLEDKESWVFADAFAERLRFEVDRKWHGELPRTYFYDAAHRVTAVSGKVDGRRLEQWIKAD